MDDDDFDEYYNPPDSFPRPSTPRPMTPEQPTTSSSFVHIPSSPTSSHHATLSPPMQHPPSLTSPDLTSSPVVAPLPSTPQQPIQWHDEHAEFYNKTSPATTLSIHDDLEDRMYCRYGFVNSGLPSDLPTTDKWEFARRMLGTADTHVSKGLRGHIAHFVECMITADRDKVMPRNLWDLTPECESPLAQHANFELQVSKLMDNRIRDSKPHYIIKARNAKGNNMVWQLMVDDAATILQCFHQEKVTIRDISLALLSSGQPFSTRIPKDQCHRASHHSQPRLTLGWRPPAHIPTTAEYGYYEDMRRHFFSQPRSHAAFLKGRIIWHLAMESIGLLANELVLDGPSDKVLHFGTSLKPTGLWDDDLNDSNMELICGVYKVFTGEWYGL